MTRTPAGLEAATVTPSWWISDQAKPKLAVELNAELTPVHPFEAYVASLLDGHHTLKEIAAAAALGMVELKAIVMGLADRRLVELKPPAAPVAVTAADEATLVKTAPTPIPIATPPPVLTPAPLRPAELLHEVATMEQRGDIDGAIALLDRGVGQLKNPAPLLNRKALLLAYRKHDYTEAIRLMTVARKLDPNNHVYEMNLLRLTAATH